MRGLCTVQAARRPLVVVGPSGSGKGTLVAKLIDEYPANFRFSVSHTTRNPRPGEINGVSYHFTNREVMQQQINEGKFLEHAEVHGNMYGTALESVQKVAESGQICIIEIDIQGAESVRKAGLASHYMFVQPPSNEILEKRLRGRGTEDEEQVNRVD